MVRPRLGSTGTPVTQAFGDTPSIGTAGDVLALASHRHGMPANPLSPWSVDGSGNLVPTADDGDDIGTDAKRVSSVKARIFQAAFPPGGNGKGLVYIFAQSDTDRGDLNFFKARDNAGAAEVVQNGDLIGQIIWNGWDGSAWREAAFMRASIWGTPGASDMPGNFEFGTTPDGAASAVSRWRILPDGTFVPTADATANTDIGQAAGRVRALYAQTVKTDALQFPNVISPTTIATSSVTAYAPTGAATASIWRLSASTPTSIHGIAAISGHLIHIINVGGSTITIKQNSATETVAANKIICLSDVALATDVTITLYYDPTSARWRKID